MSVWRRWLEHPEKIWARNAFFYVHLCVGAAAGLYIAVMSISGSIIVYRNELLNVFSVEWVVDLHANLLTGRTGHFVNGIGASSLLLLCFTGAVIWWPGINHWRRALTVSWTSQLGRLSWDLHSAMGFWFFLLVLMWAISALYFVFPNPFYSSFALFDPADDFTDEILYLLTRLHFGRFNSVTRLLWVVLGLVPAGLAVTGVFLCCRRMIYGSQTRGATVKK